MLFRLFPIISISQNFFSIFFLTLEKMGISVNLRRERAYYCTENGVDSGGSRGGCSRLWGRGVGEEIWGACGEVLSGS